MLGRGIPGVGLENKDFRGGERPVRRDSSPEYNQAEGPGSPEYPTPSVPSSPKYPVSPKRPTSPKYPTSAGEAGMKAGTATPAATGESTPSRMVSPAAGVEAIRPKLAESGTSVKGLRADWETEDESSPDSGLGGPESRAPRRSPARSPTLRSAAGSSMSGLSSSETASSVGGSTGV